MATPGLTRTYVADTDIPAYTLVKIGATPINGSYPGSVAIAASATDKIIGPSENVPTPAGRDCDVVLEGTATVIAGGTIAAEDFVTSDANGHAITATPGTGATVNFFGKAKNPAVSGDYVEVRLSFGQLKG